MKLDLGSENNLKKENSKVPHTIGEGNRTINNPTQSSAIQHYP